MTTRSSAVEQNTEQHAESLFYLGAGPLAAILLGVVPDTAARRDHGLQPVFAFMALTIVVSKLGGRGTAVATALVSALSLDFFLTQPYLHLAIDDKHDIIAFVGLAACGLIAAALGPHTAAASRPGDDPPPRPRRSPETPRRGGRADPGSSQDLLRRVAGRRQDLRHARGRAGPARGRRRRRDRVDRDARPRRDRRPGRRLRAAPAPGGRVPRGAAPGVRPRRRPRAASPPCSWWTSWPTPTRPEGATRSAGRTSTSSWRRASTSTPRSTSSTWRA